MFCKTLATITVAPSGGFDNTIEWPGFDTGGTGCYAIIIPEEDFNESNVE